MLSRQVEHVAKISSLTYVPMHHLWMHNFGSYHWNTIVFCVFETVSFDTTMRRLF